MSQSNEASLRSPKSTRWIGKVVVGVVVAQMLLSVAMKLLLPNGVPEHFAELGWRIHEVRIVACVELVCTMLYVLRRTRLWGAIVLTGYLGGAVAAHVRIGDGVFLYPLVLGAAVWIALRLTGVRLSSTSVISP